MLTVYGSQPDGGVAAPDPHDVGQVHAAAVGDAVLAVAGENEVVVPQRPGRTDLRRLLAEQRRPEAQLALPLQRGGLRVDPPDDHQVLVQGAQLLVRNVLDPGVELRVADAFPCGGDQLDQVLAGPALMSCPVARAPGGCTALAQLVCQHSCATF